MYERMKVVFDIGKSFTLEAAAPDKDDFYYQLLSNFKDALNDCDYKLNINYVECADQEHSEIERVTFAIAANEPVSQGLDLIYAVFRFMSERMTQTEYLDFMACVKAILNN